MGPLMQACSCQVEVDGVPGSRAEPCKKCVGGRVPTAAGLELLELLRFQQPVQVQAWNTSSMGDIRAAVLKTRDRTKYHHEREMGERYAAELDQLADYLTKNAPLGKVKAIGRLEAVELATLMIAEGMK